MTLRGITIALLRVNVRSDVRRRCMFVVLLRPGSYAILDSAFVHVCASDTCRKRTTRASLRRPREEDLRSCADSVSFILVNVFTSWSHCSIAVREQHSDTMIAVNSSSLSQGAPVLTKRRTSGRLVHLALSRKTLAHQYILTKSPLRVQVVSRSQAKHQHCISPPASSASPRTFPSSPSFSRHTSYRKPFSSSIARDP